MAGSLMTAAARRHKAPLLPVDSEHSAIFQCLEGQQRSQLHRILLTASGGPFRRLSKAEMASVTVGDALNHPTWKMGAKITVDSATLMNKGFEVIEACRLFNIPPANVKVIVHPQSTIHSMVEFVDGSLLAQLSVTDMRLPILYALTYPDRIESELRFPVTELKRLDFAAPDFDKFPCLRLAYEAADAGGSKTIALNAADEVAVAAFLEGGLRFRDIPRVIEQTLSATPTSHPESINRVLSVDKEARARAAEIAARLGHPKVISTAQAVAR